MEITIWIEQVKCWIEWPTMKHLLTCLDSPQRRDSLTPFWCPDSRLNIDLLACSFRANGDPVSYANFVTHHLRCTTLLFAFFNLLHSYIPFTFSTFSSCTLGSSLLAIFHVDKGWTSIQFACIKCTLFSRLIWHIHMSDRNPLEYHNHIYSPIQH